MLEATSYGLIALGAILGAAFCFVWVEEKAARRANGSARLADQCKMNPVGSAAAGAVNRSRTESAGRKQRTGLALSIQMTSPAQARTSGPDGNGNSLPPERGPAGVSRG
jgi:hypothetical protein